MIHPGADPKSMIHPGADPGFLESGVHICLCVCVGGGGGGGGVHIADFIFCLI